MRPNSGEYRSSGGRGYSHGISMSATMRPGRPLITSTRLDRYTASEIEWVMNIAANRLSWNRRCSSVCIFSRVISSSAPNGSSKRASCGSATRARAIDTRIRMPPESSRGCCFSKPSSPTSASASRARRARSADGTPASSPTSSTFFWALRHSSRVASWKTKLVTAASTSRLPWLMVSRPAARRRRVDLPHPEGPTTDTNSPREMSMETPVSARVPVAKSLVTSRRASVGAVVTGAGAAAVIP